jgi:Protein of unknown function (DUF2937)
VKYLLFHIDPGLARATFADWVPTFSLSVDGIIFAVLFGLVLWLLFMGIWWGIDLAVYRAFSRPRHKQRPPPPVRPPKIRREPIFK